VERGVYLYYRGSTLYAARLGPWKAHFITRPGYGAEPATKHEPPLLFHLRRDPSEKHNLAAQNADVIAHITAAVEQHRAGLRPAPSQLVEVVP
jgi:hypothetical protein